MWTRSRSRVCSRYARHAQLQHMRSCSTRDITSSHVTCHTPITAHSLRPPQRRSVAARSPPPSSSAADGAYRSLLRAKAAEMSAYMLILAYRCSSCRL